MMSWQELGAVVGAFLGIGAAWVALSTQVAALGARIDDLKLEMTRVRDRLDKLIDQRQQSSGTQWGAGQ